MKPLAGPSFDQVKDFVQYLRKQKAAEAAANLPPAENAAMTQIIGTLPTYRKADEMLAKRGATGRGIDFGAGLGEGAKVMRGRFETYEPFAKDWRPTYSSAEEVPSEAFNRLTNLNVLNVVPPSVRDEIVQNIGRVMEPGGLGVLTTRGKDVMSAKGRPGPEPMSIITSRDTYQKGFTPTELQEYLRYMLGEGFDIEPARLGPAGALIRKKAEGGLAEFKKGGHSTPAWQRKEGQNPEGGLNAAGRASYKRETGGTLKPPVSSEAAKKSPAKAARRKSFCARMTGMPGPMKDESGKPTRKALALRKWDC